MEIFFGNRVERLYQELKVRLFAHPTTPFTQRYVIVPSPAMRTWLLKTLAEDPEIEIATGIQVTYIEEALSGLIARFSVDPKNFPSKISFLECSLRLEVEIEDIFNSFSLMQENDKAVWQPLVNYIDGDSHASRRRIVSLASKLASLFDRYEIYGQSLLQLWKQSPLQVGEWQKALWRRCVGQVYPAEMKWVQQDCAIHLFGQTFLPKHYYTIFNSLAESNNVNCYFLSPCQLFWSEILSDTQCAGLLQRLEKEGVQEAQQLALEEYIYDRNPVLANFGRVGREMALLIEKGQNIPKECYQLSSHFQLLPFYAELMGNEIDFSENSKTPSLLECLQADLLLMRRPNAGEVIHFSSEEKSIQIHQASSPMREVESLYDTLIQLLDRHQQEKDPIFPEDVIVMAPDITQYEPYIRAVFSRKESFLDYQLLDLNLLSRYPLIQGVVSLLSLTQSKWDVSSVLELFENPIFQNKQKLSLEDLQMLKRWIETAGIRWGMDGRHRQQFLKHKYNKEVSPEKEPAGTWNLGLRKLLLGTIMAPHTESVYFSSCPLDGVESSQTELLGRYMELIDSLEKDLRPLGDGTQHTLNEWALYLKCLIKSYFLDLDDLEQDDAAKKLNDFLGKLNLDHKFPGKRFPFSTIQTHLDTFLNQKIFGYKESHLHAVRFCSLLPMRALPAKVIVLLGMDEESYPRKEAKESLNLLKTHPKSDYCPSLSDFDRYIFLEVVLSARKYILFFYSAYSSNDGKEQNISILVSELMGYLDSGFAISDKKPSEACLVVHPFSPCDRRLFVQNTHVQSYSDTYHRAAKVLSGEKLSHSVISNFSISELPTAEIPRSVDIKSLTMVARNPIEAFFKKRLKIYLKEFEGLEKRNEEDFVLGTLEHFLLKQEGIKQPLNSLLEKVEKKGGLPSGPFRSFSVGKIEREIKQVRKNLNDLQVDTTEVFDVYLSAEIESPQRNDNGHWVLPALECCFRGQRLHIEGKIPQVSPRGLISLQNEDKMQLVKSWPHYLIFTCLSQKYSFLSQGEWLFAKSCKSKKFFLENPLSLFEKYLDYHFTALEQLSPLIPEWVGEFIKNDSTALQKKIEALINGKDQYFFNPYVKWAFHGIEKTQMESLMNNWHPKAVELFGVLF